MRVLLIQPPYPFSEFPKPSSALMYLGAVLKQAGVTLEVLDLLSTRFSLNKVEKALTRFQPDLIGATSVTMNFPKAVQILQFCKKVSPTSKVVMGGPHVTFLSEETLQAVPEIDVIVRGEGEETIQELALSLDRREDWGRIKGITFRHNGSIIRNEDRPFIDNLDRLPLPDRALFPLSRYLAMHVPASVLTSRGCPTGCSFCVGYRMTGRQGRFRDPRRVADEMENAHRLGFSEICIDDDLFTRNRKHVLRICEEIAQRGLRLKLYLFARVDTVDFLLLEKLKEAGCSMICFGLESASQRILDRANKRTTVDKARQAIKLCHEAGISPFGSFILGLPGETKETMEETLSFAQSLAIPYGFHLLSPFPGTKIRERAAEYGIRILTDDWSLYDADHAVTETETLPAVEAENFAKAFFKGLTAKIEEMKEGTLAGTYEGPFREEMGKRLEVDFAWKLLSGDLIEEHGNIPLAEVPAYTPGNPLPEDPLSTLAQRLTRVIPLPPAFVTGKLQRLSERGLLVCQKGKDAYRWEWKEIRTEG